MKDNLKKMKEKLEKSKALVSDLERTISDLENQLKKVQSSSNQVKLSELNPGDTFKIGEHDFIVLEQDMQNHTTKAISKGFMTEDTVFDEDTRDYSKSNLKKVIEEDIQPIIEAEVGEDNIVEHTVDLVSVDMQKEFEPCTCKVRPLTFDESRKYNDLLVNKELEDWWWTCTPWSTDDRDYKHAIAVVSSSGDFDYCFCDYCYGVRPFCILKSDIFVA